MKNHFKSLHKNLIDPLTRQPIAFIIEKGVYNMQNTDPTNADKIYDWKGAYVLPGFVDAHCHILPTGLDLKKLNLSICNTREQVLKAIQKEIHNLNQNSWLLAVHYDQNKFEDSKHITLEELDAITKNIPTILRHTSGHACLVNTIVLNAAQINSQTDDPQGGTIGRNNQGEPNGLLLENAMELAYKITPPPSKQEMLEAILLAAKEMAKYGITCAADMMTGHFNLENELWAYQKAAEQRNTIKTRLYVEWEKILGDKHHQITYQQNEHTRICGVKLFADGAIGAGTAAMTDPYPDNTYGKLIYSQEQLNQKIKIADDAGYPVAIHSIGDRSTDCVIQAIQTSKTPSKHRIEHVMFLRKEQIKKIATLQIAVTLQPEFMTKFQHAYTKQLGIERTAQLKPARTLLNAGVKVAFSSDRPIVTGNPWEGIHAACDRKAPYDSNENITLQQAIHCYTTTAAQILGDSPANITHGKPADFQIYEKSPLQSENLPVACFVQGIQTL
jgi:predicted amidohydrolase YtcJ